MKNSRLMEKDSYLQKLKTLHQNKNIQEYSVFLVKTLSRLLCREDIRNIFDIGSGSGNNSYLFIKIFDAAEVYSFDYVKHNLDYGVQAGLIKNPVLANVYEIEKKVESSAIGLADLVFFGDVIEHLDNVSFGLKNIHSVLRPGGFFVVHTPNAAYSEFFQTPEDPTHLHEFRREELVNLLHNNGFSVEYCYPSGFPILNKVSSRISQRLGYTFFGAFLFKLIPILGPSIFVVAKKK